MTFSMYGYRKSGKGCYLACPCSCSRTAALRHTRCKWLISWALSSPKPAMVSASIGPTSTISEPSRHSRPRPKPSAPVRVLVFADRVEIISPGHLPNNLTIENIKAGNSNMRNPILASFAAKLLPYRGLGSGLLRALRAWPQIELIDDRAGNLFKAIVARPQEQAA